MMKLVRSECHAIEKMSADDSASPSLCWLVWHARYLKSLAKRRAVSEKWRGHAVDGGLYVSYAAMVQAVWPDQNAVDLAEARRAMATRGEFPVWLDRAITRCESGWTHDGWVAPDQTDRRWTTFNFAGPNREGAGS